MNGKIISTNKTNIFPTGLPIALDSKNNNYYQTKHHLI